MNKRKRFGTLLAFALVLSMLPVFAVTALAVGVDLTADWTAGGDIGIEFDLTGAPAGDLEVSVVAVVKTVSTGVIPGPTDLLNPLFMRQYVLTAADTYLEFKVDPVASAGATIRIFFNASGYSDYVDLGPNVDKTLLKQALDDFPDHYTQNLYDPDLWQAAVDAREAGQDVYDDPTAIQDEVDEALEDLLDAIDALGDPMIPLVDITGIPTTAVTGDPPIDLNAAAVFTPTIATFKDIEWTLVDADGTGVSLTSVGLLSNFVNPTTPITGGIIVKATVINGTAYGTDFEKQFTIEVTINQGTDITLSSPDVLMIKKGAYAYVSIFTDAHPSLIVVEPTYNSSFIDVAPVGQNTVQCITAKKAGTTVLTFTAGSHSKTIVVIVN